MSLGDLALVRRELVAGSQRDRAGVPIQKHPLVQILRVSHELLKLAVGAYGEAALS